MMEAPLSTKPIRRVLKWQAIATVAIAAVGRVWRAGDGRQRCRPCWEGSSTSPPWWSTRWCSAFRILSTAGGTVAALFRAEASKILVIIVQLWLVLTTYKDVVPAAFFATFVITVLLFRMALFDRD